MNILLYTTICFLFIVSISAQNNFTDTKPEPIRGCDEIRNRIVYPESARYSGIEGEVIVKIVIDCSGEISKINVLKNLSKDCDSVVVQAIKSTKFKPAKRNGHTVKTEVIVPIVFKLN